MALQTCTTYKMLILINYRIQHALVRHIKI